MKHIISGIIMLILFSSVASAAAPVADFSSNPTSGVSPLPVTFTDLSTNSPIGWTWYFGDEDLSAAWTEINSSSGWSGREDFSSVVLSDGSIVIMGGYDPSAGITGNVNDTWMSNDNGSTWTEVNSSSGWSARYGHRCVVLPDDSIVLMGGDDGSLINDVWRSNDAGAIWIEMNSSSGWSPRRGHSSVALPDGSIVVMGGYSGTDREDDVWRSTDNGATWTEINSSVGWSGREYHSSVVLHDGSILMMGGADSSVTNQNDTWRSTDNGATWSEVNSSSGWSPRSSHSTVVLPDDSVMLMGGFADDVVNDVWRSNDNGSTWTEVNSSAGWSARYSQDSVVLPNGDILIMGGDDYSNLNDVWSMTTAGSNEQNPSHTYTQAGTYQVALQAYNNDGYNNTIKTDYITATDPVAPVAAFTSNTTSGSFPLIVGFTDLSSNSPTGWAWYFGDEDLSEESWTEVNSSAAWSARYGHSSVVLPDGSIVLTGGFDDDDLNDTWRSIDNGVTWTLMNVSSGWGPRTSHSSVVLPDGSIVLTGGYYGTSSYYNDTWRSTDNGATWALMNTSSGWSARYGHSSVVLSDGSIVLTGGFDDDDLNDTWRSIDNGATWTLMNASSGWGVRCSHKSVVLSDDSIVLMGGYYGSSGYYNDTWKSIDNGATWTLMNASPGWSARYSPGSVALPDDSIVLMGGYGGSDYNDTWRSTDNGTTWTLVNSSSGWEIRSDSNSVVLPDGSIVIMGGYGDSSFNDTWRLATAGSTEQNPTHTYNAADSYKVALQVYNSAGYNVTTEASFITATEPAPVASFIANVTSGEVPLSVNFTDTSINIPSSWFWDFGDGTNSSDQNPIHSYTSAGTYNVSLNATNAAGSNISIQIDYITAAVVPVSNFSANVTSGGAPLSVIFTDNSLNSPTSWFWDFGDGSNSTSQNPTHTYASAGTYNVSLNATNVGGSNVSTQLSYITAYAVPVANFSANITSGAIPLSVNFTDLSTNTPTSWYWDFGDGSNSSLQNPIHTYASAGTYTVSLNASNIGGNNISTQTDYITAAVNPVANFSANVTSGATPLSVNFTDLSLNSPTSWFWDFGDGTNSTDQSPTHIYTSAGTYNVSLNATNVGGSNVSTQLSYITTAAIPVSNFSANVTSGTVPLSVNFTDLSTNSPTSWFWDFGDDSNSTVQNPIHTYTSAGTYNVSLNATNIGGSNISTQLSYITVAVTPVANFSANVTSGAVPLSVNFTDLSTNSPTSWFWDFGDGANSTDQSPTHIYTSAGTYNVSLNATNVGGSNVSTQLSYITTATIPVSNFSANVTSGTVPLSVNFTDLSTNSPTSWFWDFGDDSNSTVQNPIHTYTSAGTYNVSLNATNIGGSNISTQLSYITVAVTPVANFSANVTSGAVPLSVNFTDLSTNSPTSWFWNFGDGANSTDQSPTHIYTSAGTYNVSLNATNVGGSNVSTQLSYITTAAIPVSNFSANVTSGTVPLSVNFTDLSTNSPTSWFWDFGDDSNSTVQNPIHTYTSAGTYNVSLNATNIGGSNISTQLSYITVAVTPVANFSANVTSGAVPLSVNFTDLSINSPTSWFWDFGDGTNSTDQSPTHIYTSAGTYNVSLNATNVGGSNVSTQLSYITTAVTPVANFSANVTSGAIPLSVNFTDRSLNSPTSWYWDFGDGTNSTDQNATHTYASAGTYNVSLNATNVGGSNVSTELSYITAYMVPVSNFSANVTEGAVPLTVNFTDHSLNSPDSWKWDFGDGNNSTSQNPAYTYSSAGTYNVSLNATNIAGSDITTKTAYISVYITPVANFTASVTSGTAPLSVSFTDLSNNTPTSWLWNFGDGSNSTSQNPTHSYTAAGSYNITMNVTNAAGSNVSTRLYYINVSAAPSTEESSNDDSGVRASVSQGQDPKIVSQSAFSVKRVTGGSEVEYDFSDSGTPVLGVSFDAKDDKGLVVAKVQVLSSNPDGVPSPSGKSYQMLSIDVGSEGTISSDSAENVMIHFKVNKQWIEENNIDLSTIRMTRYHGDQWNNLPTSQESEDGEYYYFYAETPGFSVFNVVGDEIGETSEQDAASESAVEEVEEPAEEEETSGIPGFTAIAGLMFVSLAVLIRRK